MPRPLSELPDQEATRNPKVEKAHVASVPRGNALGFGTEHFLIEHVCLITSTHICRNPRLVKEAYALNSYGFKVTVVALGWGTKEAALDGSLAKASGSDLIVLDVAKEAVRSRLRWLRYTVKQRVSSAIHRVTGSARLEESAFSRYHRPLAKLAIKVRADLYIAHNLQALPAAALASDCVEAFLGFDAEDYHRGEFIFADVDSAQAKVVKSVEERLIPKCDYVTAASEGIAQAYCDSLRIVKPTVIHNVFSPHERDANPIAEGERESSDDKDEISLYWFSQTIGEDRGLQDVLKALARLDSHVHLNLRGEWDSAFEDVFWRLARCLGVETRVHILGLAHPREMIARASYHDIGLALEQPISLNKQICLSNKIATYLTAGLPVIATNTEGQRWLANQVPDAVKLYEPGDVATLVRGIKGLINDDHAMHKARKAAVEFVEEKFNWDIEARRFVNLISELD